MTAGPLMLGIETLLRRDGRRHRAGARGARQRDRLLGRGAGPVRRRRARDRRPCPPGGACARAAARARRRGGRIWPTSTRSPSPRARGWRARSWSASAPRRRSPSPPGKPLYGVNHLVGHVTADQLHAAGGGAATGGAADRRPARLGRPHLPAARARPRRRRASCSARPSTTPRGRRSTRPPGCSGCPTRAARPIDRAAAEGDPRAIRFPRGLTQAEGPGAAPVRLLVLRAEDRGRALRGAARGRGGAAVAVADVAASFREAVVDVLVTKALDACARDRGAEAAARRRRRRQPPAARGGRRARGRGGGARSGSRRFDLCTDNGAMIAGLGARLVEAGVAPSGAGFGVDSTLPVGQVQIR